MNQLNTITLHIEDSWVVYDASGAMFPGLTTLADGTLLASFSTVPDGLPGGEVQVIRSFDQGRTWSKPSIASQSRRPEGAVLNAVGITALRDGTVLLPLNDVVTGAGFITRNATLHILQSSDGGWTWECQGAIAPEINEPFTYGAIVELPNGELLCPIWGRWQPDERWRSAALFSRDGGRSWSERATIAYDPDARLHGEYVESQVSGFDTSGQFDPTAIAQPNFRPHSAVDGFSETSVIVLPDGRLLATLRQQGVEGRSELSFYQSLSSDAGRTWTPYRRTNLCGMSPCLHISPGGRLLLAYRRCAPEDQPDAVPGLSIAESHDDGATWQEVLTLREPKGTVYTGEYQVGYPAIVNTADGRILVVYYSYDESLPHRRYIAANLLSEVTP